MKHDCQSCLQWLGAYLDGELDATQRVRVEEHLRDCAACRAQLATLETLYRLVKEKDTGPSLAEDYWDWHRQQVWKRIRGTGRRRRHQPFEPVFSWFRVAVLAGGLAVILVLAVIGWQLWSGTQKPGFDRIASHTPDSMSPTEAFGRDRRGPESLKKVVSTARDHGSRAEAEVESQPSLREYHSSTSAPGTDSQPEAMVTAAKVGVASEKRAGTVTPGVNTPAEKPSVVLPLPIPAPLDQPAEVVSIAEVPRVRPEDTATVLVRALIEPDGSVSRLEIERSSGSRFLDTIALLNVQRAKFQPAMREGRKVRSWITVPQLFRADEAFFPKSDSGRRQESQSQPGDTDR